MSRIAEEELERLKYEISLERLVEARGVVLRKRGEELIGLCPFHEDHSPSLVVNPSKNLWNCLGACQTGGTVIDWVMKAEGVSFRHAVELLRNDYSPAGVTSAISQQVSKISTVTKLKSVVSKEGDAQERLRQVLNYYTETLKQSPEALAYLAQRGLNSGDAIELFRLGYANRTLGYHIPFKNRSEGAEIRGQLEAVGIYRKSGHEHFSGCLVIPINDEHGVVHEVYGRRIKRVKQKGLSEHLYLPGPHRSVWNVAALAATSEVILCESLIDALTFWCAGYRNVTASYGINGFTEDHLSAFHQYGIERVLIAYDRDDAGDKAAASLAEKLMGEGLECFRIQFPRGMDANEYALSVKPAEKSLGLVIRKAVWLGKGRGRMVDGVRIAECGVRECDKEKDDETIRKESPRSSSLAKSDGVSGGNVSDSQAATHGGKVQPKRSDTQSSSVDTSQHSRGSRSGLHEGLPSVSSDSQRQPCRIGYSSRNRATFELSERGECEPFGKNDSGCTAAPIGANQEPSDQVARTPHPALRTPSPSPLVAQTDVTAGDAASSRVQSTTETIGDAPPIVEIVGDELAASPVPTAPRPQRIDAEVRNGEVSILLGDRRWRIRGLEKNKQNDKSALLPTEDYLPAAESSLTYARNGPCA